MIYSCAMIGVSAGYTILCQMVEALWLDPKVAAERNQWIGWSFVYNISFHMIAHLKTLEKGAVFARGRGCLEGKWRHPIGFRTLGVHVAGGISPSSGGIRS
jgi:hypothetical protein